MKKFKILLVEDEILIGLYLRKQLEGMGHEVSGPIPSGEEALEKVTETRPDILLIDINLKGEMNGIETAKRISAGLKEIQVAFMTGYSSRTMKEESMQVNTIGYLVKPVKPTDLKSLLESLANDD